MIVRKEICIDGKELAFYFTSEDVRILHSCKGFKDLIFSGTWEEFVEKFDIK